MIHEELRGLIPLLALDALPAAEEHELIAHLKVCRECSELLDAHKQTAGWLGLCVPSVRPSADLRERILHEAAQNAQLTPGRPAEPRPRRSWAGLGLKVASVTALAASLAFGGLTAQRLNDKILEKDGRLNEQSQVLAQQRKALDLASASSTIVLPLSPSQSYGGVQGKVVFSDRADKASVLLTGLQDPAGDVYTLWVTPYRGKPRNLADFVPDASGLAVINLDRAVYEKDTLAVTREARPGADRPRGPVIGSAYRTPNTNPLTVA